MSRPPGSQGKNPFLASPRTPGPLGQNDAADPDTPDWFLGDTPGPTGLNDYADPTGTNFSTLSQPSLRRGPILAFAGFQFVAPLGVVPASSVFDITKIPGIMRSHKWNSGAQLMDNWFSRSANDDPFKGVPDTTTIKMDSWVLTFDRARKVYDQMISDKIYANPAAQKEITKMLKGKKLLGSAKSPFGDFSRPVPEIDVNYINERTVGSITDDLDDMFAALGRFNLRMAVKGFVLTTSVAGKSTYTVTIDAVGVYVRDSYDFNDDSWFSQPLGFWNEKTNYAGRNPFLGTEVTNKDFRDWRTAHNKGGDFLVYSDLKVIKLSPPQVFDFK